MVPRLRVRDQAALRAQFPGQSPDEIAEALISAASRAAAATGGAAGLWAVVPVVTAFPAEVLAETLVVVGIEVKLVAELHEAFGLRADGNFAERMRAYLAAWAHRRGVFMIPGGMIFAAAAQARCPGGAQHGVARAAVFRCGRGRDAQRRRDAQARPGDPPGPASAHHRQLGDWQPG
jgi:hypothetical protein